MPRLLIFAPCERVIIDQHNVISIITVLQELRLELPELPQPPAENTDEKTPVIPMKWDVLTFWTKTDDDEPETIYQTRFALIDPTGRAFSGFGGSMEFSFQDKTNYRLITTVLGFPVLHDGRHLVRLWLHKKGEPEGDAISEFPIVLTRSKPKD